MGTTALRLASVAVLGLAGCASPSMQAFRSGDNYTACKLLVQQGPRDSTDLNNLGFCYGHGHYVSRDSATAIRYWTQAARYGHTTAISNLAQAGAPVPPADLAARGGGYDPAAAAATIQLLQAMQPRVLTPAPAFRQPVNCLSSPAGGNVLTQCQ